MMAEMEQDDIDKLLAEALGDANAEAMEAPLPEEEETPSSEESSVHSQDDIDALLSEMGAGDDAGRGDADAQESEAPAAEPEGIDALFREAEEPADVESEAEAAGGDLGALLQESGLEPEEEPGTGDDIPVDPSTVETVFKARDTEERLADDLLPQEAEAARALFDEEVIAPEPAAEAEPVPEEPAESAAATSIMPGPAEPPRARPAPAAVPPPIRPAAPSLPPLADLKSIQESLSLMTSAGEVEGIAGQIASLLGQLSERARRFQNAWLGADQEAKQLRTTLSGTEHRESVLKEEKAALADEVMSLRSRLSKIEGEKLAGEEGKRTQISALELKLREQESRAQMLATEVAALKEELNHARNESTGADLESRRARFELDRLRSELDAERMERMRLQRALDNREKEIQAIQSQTAGQASSLFLDELHRLVRRLENEMDVRTSAAHEALAVLDRMKVPDELVAVASNVRTALLTAAGLTVGESEDALRALAGQAKKPGQVVEPIKPDDGKASLAAFESALVALDTGKAEDLARTLLRETYTTPAHLMSKIYLCPALRTAEVGTHLRGVVKLLQNLKETQAAADRTLGREGPETERMLVQMFDYLHNLVRLKHISRTTAEAWQFFLDLRGRYSFVTSDKQWAEYRDRVLSGS